MIGIGIFEKFRPFSLEENDAEHKGRDEMSRNAIVVLVVVLVILIGGYGFLG